MEHRGLLSAADEDSDLLPTLFAEPRDEVPPDKPGGTRDEDPVIRQDGTCWRASYGGEAA